VKSVYENLGCTVNSLCLVSSKYKDSVIEDLIMSSDIIYIGGGNTKKMMKVWKKYKVDQYLIEAYKKGVIMSGLSAGAICWFKVGHSDSEFIEGKKDADHIIVEGLGLIPYAVCPHYNEPERKSFDKMVKDLPFASIALEDNTALVYENNDFRIIRSDNSKDAYIFIGGLKTKLTAIDL
ncbi:MAG TPA: type 1 glutamine amidotransferase-like domain-containing protein, partial [Acholeplasmataceae bacterium]|nr:type 1 glutamine amidotransferase-like domain-containing protein [Acholeplasmataceae bacterium]